jgi:hypothetical protein
LPISMTFHKAHETISKLRKKWSCNPNPE